jgi:hypothetical protein
MKTMAHLALGVILARVWTGVELRLEALIRVLTVGL